MEVSSGAEPNAATAPDPRRLATRSGIAVAALFGVGSAIWALDMPEDGTPAAAVVAFYEETAERIVVGGSLSLLGIAAFLLFAAAVRRVLLDAGGEETLATAGFGGAVLAMSAGVGAETINMAAALRAREGELGEALARSLFEVPQMLGAVATGLGLGVFALATAAEGMRTGLLPRWLAAATLLVGLALISPLSHVNWLSGAALVLVSAALGLALRPRSA